MKDKRRKELIFKYHDYMNYFGKQEQNYILDKDKEKVKEFIEILKELYGTKI